MMEGSGGRSIVLRVLSGVGGVAILLTSALLTLGASLAAPIGVFVAHRRARSRARPLTQTASWISAMIASTTMLVLGALVLSVFIPPNTWREMQEGVAEAQAAQDTVPAPEWVKKAFPRTAQSDSLSKQVTDSPGFFLVAFAVGVLFTCVFLGAVGGTVGWVASEFLRYAFWGSTP